jgi:hypothetical protein
MLMCDVRAGMRLESKPYIWPHQIITVAALTKRGFVSTTGIEYFYIVGEVMFDPYVVPLVAELTERENMMEIM